MITALDLTSSGYRFYKENQNKPYCDGGWYKTIYNDQGLKMYQIGFYFWVFPGNPKLRLSCETVLFHRDRNQEGWSQVCLEFSPTDLDTVTNAEQKIAIFARAIDNIPDPINN